ncbi:transposase DNA-binding-containing protein [Burkholderia ubonensis]|uniref:IS4/Tn5 family transposase DNA-binding protein n=1 Tax=Burkholderia ubonensis TaxID=101571 RepID=UPI0012F96450
MTCWTETEFARLDLGDARVNKRARTLMERLASTNSVRPHPVADHRGRSPRLMRPE